MEMHVLKLASALTSALLLSSVASAADLTADSLATVKQNIDNGKAVLVDVREKKEWDAGHVEGAVFLPLSKLNQGVDAASLAGQLPQDKILYTHCVMGIRSVTAGNTLERLGYEVRPLKPGYKEMVAAGFKPAQPASK